MHKPTRKKRLRRTLLECVGAVAFVLAGTAVSNADPTVTGQVEHFVTCFGLMITDPVQHESECGPGIPAERDPVETIGASSAIMPTWSPTTTITFED